MKGQIHFIFDREWQIENDKNKNFMKNFFINPLLFKFETILNINKLLFFK